MSASDSNRSLQRISELLNGRASTTRREVKSLTIASTSIAAGQRKISVWLWDAQTDKCLQKSFHFGKLNALPSLKIDRAFTLPKKSSFMYGLWGCCLLGRINALFGRLIASFGTVTAFLGTLTALLGKLSALLCQNGAVSLRIDQELTNEIHWSFLKVNAL